MDRADFPGERLLGQSILIVRQEAHAGRRPDYHVFDADSAPVATARYESGDEVERVLRTFGLRHRTAAVLRVADTAGDLVFTVVLPGFRGGSVMFIRDSEDHGIGTAIKAGGFRRVRYDLRDQGRSVGSMQVMDRRQSEVRVTDNSGTEVAAIRTITAAAPFDLAEEVEGYYLQVDPSLVGPLRSLVVACAIVLQAAIGSESATGETNLLRLSMIPPPFDRLRRRPGS